MFAAKHRQQVFPELELDGDDALNSNTELSRKEPALVWLSIRSASLWSRQAGKCATQYKRLLHHFDGLLAVGQKCQYNRRCESGQKPRSFL